jgi:hypothetical protein
MEPQIVVRKSQAGMQEVFHRRAGLSPKMRTLLIMLNGTRSIQELEKSLASLGDVRAMLYELNVLGLVEMEEQYEQSNVVGMGARLFSRPAPAPVPAPTPAPAPQPVFDPNPGYPAAYPQSGYPTPNAGFPPPAAVPSYAPQPAQSYSAPAPAVGMLQQLKSQLAAHMQRALGEDYLLVRAKIDGCQSIRDFANLVEGCEKVLANYLGPDAAQALKREFDGVI